MDSRWVFSLSLPAHEKDVRSVSAIGVNAGLVTASRDGSARVFRSRDSYGTADVAFQTESGKFLSVAIFVANSVPQRFTTTVTTTTGQSAVEGRVIASGADNIVYVWPYRSREVDALAISKEQPVLLLGHSNVVCALAVHPSGDILSGSWDCTARRWNSLTNECSVQFRGHEQAVWCILALPNGDVMTGSADQTIRIWSGDSGAEKAKWTGHRGAVRALAFLENSNQIVSTGNDGTFILWSRSGSILRSMSVDSFVYGMAVSGDLWFGATEDRGLVVVAGSTGVINQSIPHPGTVWDVAVLDNGDIVTGCSDGIARVWTREGSGRSASVEKILEYQNCLVAARSVDISHIAELKTKGKKDGENRVVDNRGTQEVYQWNEAEQEWKKIGDVIRPNKSMVNGKDYDFRFDIEIGEGGPTLPLGVNKGENPYTAAQRFIDENDMEQDFLQQIADFIMKNTEAPVIGAAAAQPVSQGVSSAESGAGIVIQRFIPPTRWFIFSKVGNAEGLLTSIRDEEFPDPDCFPTVQRFLKSPNDVDGRGYDILVKTLESMLPWPVKRRFVALDLLRLFLVVPELVTRLMSHSVDVVLLCSQNISTVSAPLALCALRSLANLFPLSIFHHSLLQHEMDIFASILSVVGEASDPLLTACASCLFNFALLHREEVPGSLQATHGLPSALIRCGADILLRDPFDDSIRLRTVVSLYMICDRNDETAKLAAAVHIPLLIAPWESRKGSPVVEALGDVSRALNALLNRYEG